MAASVCAVVMMTGVECNLSLRVSLEVLRFCVFEECAVWLVN